MTTDQVALIVAAVVQCIAAFATIALAVATFLSLGQLKEQATQQKEQVGQLKEQVRLAVLPQLEPYGNVLRSRKGPGTRVQRPSYIKKKGDSDYSELLSVTNIGAGPALKLQWQVGPVQRCWTHAPTLPAGESYELWQGYVDQPMPFDQGIQVDIWYADNLGNEYHNVFKRLADHWDWKPVKEPNKATGVDGAAGT